MYQPDETKDAHGRTVRSGYLREGLAGQKSSLIMDLKKGLDHGEIEVPPAEEIPYVVPGRSVKETSTDWSENVGKVDELAADTSTPDKEKWGRKGRPREK